MFTLVTGILEVGKILAFTPTPVDVSVAVPVCPKIEKVPEVGDELGERLLALGAKGVLGTAGVLGTLVTIPAPLRAGAEEAGPVTCALLTRGVNSATISQLRFLILFSFTTCGCKASAGLRVKTNKT